MVSKITQVPDRGLFSAAIHPYNASQMEVAWLDRLREVAMDTRCIALGETGLDLRQEYSSSNKQQIASFEEHIFLSNKLHKPLIIHAVKSLSQSLAKLHRASEPFIFHGFTGSTDAAQRIVERGGYISLGHKIVRDKALAERIAVVDLEQILMETDDNDVPIEDVYAALAHAKNMDIEEIKIQITQNFNRVFRLNL